MYYIMKGFEEFKAALRKKTDELSDERRGYKTGSPYEVYLLGVVQGIHYALNYPAAGLAFRPDVEGKSREQDKIKESCEHHYTPMELNFNQVDAVICPKCGDMQHRYNFVREANPKFPWTTFPSTLSETK